jgi:hypothetical protein
MLTVKEINENTKRPPLKQNLAITKYETAVS